MARRDGQEGWDGQDGAKRMDELLDYALTHSACLLTCGVGGFRAGTGLTGHIPLRTAPLGVMPHNDNYS